MNIAPNAHNIQKRIDFALANLKANAPAEWMERMHWCFTDVVMSTRLRRCAGMCRYWRVRDVMRLEFSEALFNSIGEMDKTDTVIHELSHAVCLRLSLDKGHGKMFKSVCRMMGGSGERCIKLEAGVVKRNLVKRWVLTRKVRPDKLFIRTRKDADRLPYVYPDVVLLGVIQVDHNEKKIKWVSVCAEGMRTVNPLEGKFELVA
jgi:hypothetical protein